jgi:hypothetical protein
MKIILILFNIVFLAVMISAPALKKISFIRLFTVVMLMIFSIGIIKLIILFPIPSFFSLGVGMLAVLSMAFLPRQRSIRPEMKGTDHKIRMLNWQQNNIRTKKKAISFKKEWTIS